MTNRKQDIPKRQAGSSSAQMSPAASLTRVAIRRPPASDDTSARDDDPPRVHRLFDDGPVIDDAMTVDWIVGLGREVVITGGPVHETDLVPTGGGPIRCGVIALPFGPDACVDHVLCHLYRVDPNTLEAGADTGHSLPPRDRTGIRRIFGR